MLSWGTAFFDRGEGRRISFFDKATVGALVQAIESGNDELADEIFAYGRDQCIDFLSLSDLGLTRLPSSMGKLCNSLRELYLGGNRLITTPTSVWQLSKLTVLDAPFIPLNYIPEDVGERLRNLEYLELSGNELTHIPESVGLLSRLKRLTLSDNKLIRLPFSIDQLVNLNDLQIGNNQIQSLASVCGLSNLVSLSAYKNHIAELPQSIGELSSLVFLNISDNVITSLPETFGKLTNLRRLYVYSSRLRTLPESFVHLCSLKEIYAYDNPFLSPPQHVVDDGVQAIIKQRQEGPTVHIDPDRVLASLPHWVAVRIGQYTWSTRLDGERETDFDFLTLCGALPADPYCSPLTRRRPLGGMTSRLEVDVETKVPIKRPTKKTRPSPNS